MLTKTDLNAIGRVVDQRLDTHLEGKLNDRLDKKLFPINSDISDIKRNVRKVKKDVSVLIKMADRKLVQVESRVKAIEKHLGFPETNFA